MPELRRNVSHVGDWCVYRSPAMMQSHTAAYFIVVEEHPTLPMVSLTRPVLERWDTLRKPRWMLEEYVRDYDSDDKVLKERTRQALRAEASEFHSTGADAHIHEAETAVVQENPELPMHGLPAQGKGHPPHEGQGEQTPAG